LIAVPGITIRDRILKAVASVTANFKNRCSTTVALLRHEVALMAVSAS
jgi:hypothetical protein